MPQSTETWRKACMSSLLAKPRVAHPIKVHAARSTSYTGARDRHNSRFMHTAQPSLRPRSVCEAKVLCKSVFEQLAVSHATSSTEPAQYPHKAFASRSKSLSNGAAGCA